MRTARIDDPDLFMSAIDCRAIVCAAAPNLLEGRLEPSPSPERMRAVVRAANAPGVKLVVVVMPAGEQYAGEELVLKKDGIPYVILRAAPLVEELAEATNFHVSGSLWVERGKTVSLASCADVAKAVVGALDDDSLQGATVAIPSETVDLSDALRRAAHEAGARTTVRAAPPSVSMAYRKVASWLGLSRPPALALYERLGTTTA